MKVVFFTSQVLRSSSRVLVMTLPSMIGYLMLKQIPLLIGAVIVTIVVVEQVALPGAILAVLGVMLAEIFLFAVIGTVHELGHIFAGLRLTKRSIVRALVLPTFGRPSVRFDPVPFPPFHLALVSLSGPVSALAVLGIVACVLLILPDLWGIRWFWWGQWGILVYSQCLSLVPIGETDGQKAFSLVQGGKTNWGEILEGARSLL